MAIYIYQQIESKKQNKQRGITETDSEYFDGCQMEGVWRIV